MKKQFKKIIAMLCSIALMVTGLAFMPQSAKADDTWFDAVFDTPTGVPWYHYHTDVVTPGDQAGIWDYCGQTDAQAQYKNGDNVEGFAWKVVNNKSEAFWLETDNLLNVACVKQDGLWVKPVPGMSYKLNMTIEYSNTLNGTSQLQIWNTNGYDGEVEHKDVEANKTFRKRASGQNDLTWSCENVDVFVMPGNELKFHLGVGVNSSYKYSGTLTTGATFTITDFSLIPDGDYEVVPSNNDTFKPSADVGGQTVYSPWTLSAHWIPDTDPDPNVDNGSYGAMLYNVDPAEAENIQGTTMKLANTVDGPEKYSDGTRITDPKDRWWWVSGSLLNIAEDVGLEEKYDISSGTISLNSSKATDTDCYLYVYVDNTEYQFSLTAGDNTLTIPEFIYAGGKDIKFLFDELPKNTVIRVNSIEFEQEADSWSTVPNADPTFTQGPWNMSANFIDEPDSGHYGVLQYKENKENPSSYKDYDFRVASNSGWLAWSVFARLENYCADRFDFGDPYDITIKLNSSKATVPTADEEDLDQLLVLVGSDMYYFDLVEGENTLRIQGDNYKVNKEEPHEQILFEMDGLQKGTVLTVTDIQATGPNDGWTNVPNKSWTAVGDWSLYNAWDETHWSKLAYKDNGTDSGLGAYDFKLRRVSGEWTKEASMATLSDYLNTAVDTKGNAMSDGDAYNTKVTFKATGLADSVTDYGSLMFNVNGEHFKFDVKKGTNTYDLEQLTGNTFTYNKNNTKDIDFEFDEMTAKSIVTISKIEFINKSGSGTDVPNDEAFQPEGTPWTLYAITNASEGQYGALKYSVEGDPAKLSSLKVTAKSVSGWFGARSTFASLVGRLNGLENGKEYKFTIKAKINESKVTEREVTYDKKLRIIINEKNFDYDIPENPTGTQTYVGTFTYDAAIEGGNNVVFQLDQMLKGTIFSVESVEITDPSATTTAAPTTTQETTTQETTTETTTVVPSTETTTVVPSTEAPSSETAVTTTTSGTVKTPGKAKIKKIYKKKKSAKKLKVKLKKTKGANGYQVAVYKSKKKAKKNKKALVKKYTKKLKVTIKSKKLKKKKKLYVRARAYVLDGTGKKVFGKWSAIKKAKIKK